MRAIALIALAPRVSGGAREAPAWKLTPNGLGPVRIGMTGTQVEKALKTELEGEAFDNEGSCIELFPAKRRTEGQLFHVPRRQAEPHFGRRSEQDRHPARHRGRRQRRRRPQGLWREPTGRAASLRRPTGRISDLSGSSPSSAGCGSKPTPSARWRSSTPATTASSWSKGAPKALPYDSSTSQTAMNDSTNRA